MSSDISTLDALSSSARPAAGRCWRFVEAQHRASTLKLTDTLAEQERLEALIEQTKPAIPIECRHLNYLLSTPFRYGAPYLGGSRFRRAGRTLGIFYASSMPETAAAEMAFHRLLFFAESPDTPWPANAGQYTAFCAEYDVRLALDLTRPPLNDRHESWADPIKYDACQSLAETARTLGVDAIKYWSVRDPARRTNIALLSCRAFSNPEPLTPQTWHIYLSASGVRALREFPQQSVDFDRSAFGADPRIVAMKWDRG